MTGQQVQTSWPREFVSGHEQRGASCRVPSTKSSKYRGPRRLTAMREAEVGSGAGRRMPGSARPRQLVSGLLPVFLWPAVIIVTTMLTAGACRELARPVMSVWHTPPFAA